MYASVEQLKSYLSLTSAGDDELLALLLEAATSFIEHYTGRRFEPHTETHFVNEDSVAGEYLILGDDLLELTQVGDGTGAEVPLAEIALIPPQPPHFALKRAAGWLPPLTVSGRWGYGEEPPADIAVAAVRLAGYWYRLRDAQVFDVTAIPEQGIMTLPKGLPADVKVILDVYRRRV